MNKSIHYLVAIILFAIPFMSQSMAQVNYNSQRAYNITNTPLHCDTYGGLVGSRSATLNLQSDGTGSLIFHRIGGAEYHLIKLVRWNDEDWTYSIHVYNANGVYEGKITGHYIEWTEGFDDYIVIWMIFEGNYTNKQGQTYKLDFRTC